MLQKKHKNFKDIWAIWAESFVTPTNLVLVQPWTFLERGGWTSCFTEIIGQNLQACQFSHHKAKDFKSTCSTSILGKPHKIRHHGLVPCSQVATDYLTNATSKNTTVIAGQADVVWKIHGWQMIPTKNNWHESLVFAPPMHVWPWRS